MRIRKNTAFLLLIPILLIPALSIMGETWSYQIKTVYKNSSAGSWGNEITWIFQKDNKFESHIYCEEIPDTQYRLISSETTNRLERVVQINKNGSDIVEKVIGESPSEETFFLSEGFPVPFDDLRVEDDTVKEAVIRKSAGGASFAFTVKRIIEDISAESAKESGMIDTGFMNEYDDAALMMVTVKRNKELLVKQLWCRGEKWWIYEETPFRKSWRLP